MLSIAILFYVGPSGWIKSILCPKGFLKLRRTTSYDDEANDCNLYDNTP